MADVPEFLDELVEVVAKANHDYFVRRGQNPAPWEELPPIYREIAKASHREILLDGPVDLINALITRRSL